MKNKNKVTSNDFMSVLKDLRHLFRIGDNYDCIGPDTYIKDIVTLFGNKTDRLLDLLLFMGGHLVSWKPPRKITLKLKARNNNSTGYIILDPGLKYYDEDITFYHEEYFTHDMIRWTHELTELGPVSTVYVRIYLTEKEESEFVVLAPGSHRLKNYFEALDTLLATRPKNYEARCKKCNSIIIRPVVNYAFDRDPVPEEFLNRL